MLSAGLSGYDPRASSLCADDVDWDNHSGRKCADYSREGWCRGGKLVASYSWTGGAQFNYPERACCACGKSPPAPAYTPPVATASAAPTITTFSNPSAFGASTGAAASTSATPAALASLLEALPAVEREAVQARLSTCAASSPAKAGESLLLVPRLPRSGNALMCNLLSACSARQSRSACGTTVAIADVNSVRASTCPSGQTPYAFYGNEKLSPDNYGCAAGINASVPECSSFAGEPGAACRYLGSVHPPGALMLASERFPDFTIAPCPLLRPSIKLLALLRDPGERAQSAFAYNYEACVCNFRHPWCTQFSSFRFKNRQTKLCDDHTPKHGFASALAVLRQHGNMPWPITSSETHHVLGRFTAGVVREAYAPYFGGYQATPGGPWKSSPLLARATLARCFAWVGIAEE